jgi:DMSO reductase anchor subunit
VLVACRLCNIFIILLHKVVPLMEGSFTLKAALCAKYHSFKGLEILLFFLLVLFCLRILLVEAKFEDEMHSLLETSSFVVSSIC